MNAPPDLFEYGIHTEDSDVRAHVSVVDKSVYVFPTSNGVRAIEQNKPPVRPAYQNGLREDIDLRFERIAINERQIEVYDLPTKPRKKGDVRSQQVVATVEAEAMPARTLRTLLRDDIEALLPQGALMAALVAEESERAGLLALAAGRNTSVSANAAGNAE